MRGDLTTSDALLRDYHDDQEAFLKRYEGEPFLPALAPHIMRLLARGIGSKEEFEYYEGTRECADNLYLAQQARDTANPKRKRLNTRPPKSDKDWPF